MTFSVVVGSVNRSKYMYIALKTPHIFFINWFFFILQIKPSFLQFNVVLTIILHIEKQQVSLHNIYISIISNHFERFYKYFSITLSVQ